MSTFDPAVALEKLSVEYRGRIEALRRDLARGHSADSAEQAQERGRAVADFSTGDVVRFDGGEASVVRTAKGWVMITSSSSSSSSSSSEVGKRANQLTLVRRNHQAPPLRPTESAAESAAERAAERRITRALTNDRRAQPMAENEEKPRPFGRGLS